MMRAVVLAVACLLGTAAAAIAAPEFNGRLVGRQDGRPVAGAEVMIVGLTGSVKTDADGRFAWNPTPQTPFEVIVILPGGRVTRPTLVAKHDFAAVLTIEVEAVLSEEVTVTAGIAPSIDAAAGAGMTMLTARDIALRAPANLTQALENVPGVSQVSEGQAAAPAVRGLARGRTLILLDGARVTSERRVGPSATFLDPFSVEHIDVARGPGSVAYGSDAFGGVISVRTRRPPMTAGWSGRASGTLGAGVPERRGGLELSRGHGTGAVLIQAHARAAGDYDSPAGAVLHSGWSDRGLLARLDQQVGAGLLSIGWQSDFGRDIERPRSNAATTRFFYPHDTSHRLTGSFERGRTGTFDQLRVRGFTGTFDQRTDQERLPSLLVTRRIERADVSARDVALRATAEKATARLRLEVGADINGRTGLEARDIVIGFDAAGIETSREETVSTASASRTDVGLFFHAEAPLAPKVVASGGARVDAVRTRSDGGYFGSRTISHTALSGSGALVVGPFNGLSLTAQVSRGFRDPTISDRFYRGPTGRGYITGNPDLDPETSRQVDVGARYSAARLRLAVYGYHYRITNLIERYGVGGDTFLFRNRGRATIRGVELEAQAELGGGVSLDLSAQVARGRALDGAWLDDIAPDLATMTLRRRIGTRGAAHVRLAVFGADGRFGPSEVATPGYTLVDAGGSWWITPQVEVRVLGRNLLNQSYYASPDPRWVWAPGRHGSVTAVVQF